MVIVLHNNCATKIMRIVLIVLTSITSFTYNNIHSIYTMVLRFKGKIFIKIQYWTNNNYVLIFCKLQSLDFKALTINAARFLRLICDFTFINNWNVCIDDGHIYMTSSNVSLYNFFLNQCRKDITVTNGIHPQLDACYIIGINDFLLECYVPFFFNC